MLIGNHIQGKGMSIRLLDKASLTEDEVLEVLGIDSEQLNKLVYLGKISKYHIRGKYEYMPSNIKTYLLSLKENRKKS